MTAFYRIFKSLSPSVCLSLLLLISFLFRFVRLSQPPQYIFDEVYHVPTVRAYAHNHPAAYEWWQPAPEPNTAYDWLHPPLAKLLQAGSVKLLGDHSLAWRLPSAIFGTLSLAALYFFTLTLFKNHSLALLAAALFSLDGLQLTMSRITMNDIFVTTWIIFALTFFYRFLTSKNQSSSKKLLYLTGLFTGLALATKWSALLLYPLFALFLLPSFLRFIKSRPRLSFFLRYLLRLFYSLLILPLSLYLLSYSQFFLQGHTPQDFYHLHQQIYWYQSGLTATHDYQSTALQWPFLLRPVWFHVRYLPQSTAHIYNLGNPAIFWGGLIAFIFLLSHLKRKSKSFFPQIFLILSYLGLFLPWVFSPRLLFLHHYLPALPFLCSLIALALFRLKPIHRRLIVPAYLLLALALFRFFYPLNTSIPIPKHLLKFWFWLPSWK